MENNTAMSIINAEMESLMADYNEVMLDFAEASMIEDNYTEKYEKRDKCRLVKVQIALAKGKKLYDKRQDIAKKDQRREAERDFKVSMH